ncbi:MAG: sulfotransferase domain-containing protein [Gammaproteobacteria bacterium]|nr:MAG: sulfotransferase domain-containing protein [Gammaproteobacteria bacterium]
MVRPANVTRTYQNHTIDSTRWDGFEPRAGDVIVSTSYTSSTTWTLGILYQLMAMKENMQPRPMDYWLDARMFPVELADQLAELAAMPHPRVLKSHLAADGLPIWPEVKYVVVGRDPRDVFMSLANHYEQFTDFAYQAFNETPGRVGPPMPRYDGDLNKLWREWLTRGWFDWEEEGYPWWGNMHHVASWWTLRQEPNILLVHYNDLKRDLPGEIRRMAGFVGYALTDAEVSAIAQACSLDAMRDGTIAAGDPLGAMFKDGAKGFFYKGTNERWRGILGDDELALYEEVKQRLLPPDCASWLEQGGSGDLERKAG